MDGRPSAAVVAALLSPRERGAGEPVFLGDGCDFFMFRTAADLVVRIPKHAEAADGLNMETALLSQIAPHLPIEVPAPLRVSGPRPGAPHGFGVYTKVPGVASDDAPVDAVAAAALLGHSLSRLHCLDPRGIVGLEVRATHLDSVQAWRGHMLPRLDLIRTFVPPAKTAALRALLDTASPPFAGPPVLVHGDLESEHILADPRTGILTGIIDWGDAGLGDPAVDLAGLLAWRGLAFLHAVLEHYDGPRDDGLVARAIVLAAFGGAHQVHLGHALDRPRWVAAGLRAIDHALAAPAT